MADFDNNDQRGDIFGVSVRAGKRTYFFDVRSTRSNDYYLTITESKKRFNEGSDRPFFEKHKIFLYKEDFDKFAEGLREAMEHIRTHQPFDASQNGYRNQNSGFSGPEFEDLGK